MMALSSYYSDSYCSQQNYTDSSLHAYLGGVELPTLTDTARHLLDAPLTLEELQMATGMYPKSKAPGEDGIPGEVSSMVNTYYLNC